jgi:hypothetical protein
VNKYVTEYIFLENKIINGVHMSLESDLMAVNNGLNTTLHGVRTAKMATSDTTNFILLLGGIILGILILKGDKHV